MCVINCFTEIGILSWLYISLITGIEKWVVPFSGYTWAFGLGSLFRHFALDRGQVIKPCWTKIISMQHYLKGEKNSRSSCIVVPCTYSYYLESSTLLMLDWVHPCANIMIPSWRMQYGDICAILLGPGCV